MLGDVLLWLASLLMILLSSILFTNGIELLGHRLKMRQSAVGSVLAAIGTALPETVIPIIAILVFHDSRAMDVGIGAIAGAPFMLATLGLFLTGAAIIAFSVLGRRTMEVRVTPPAVARDLTFFIVLYGTAVLTTFVPVYALRVVIALALLGSYAIYLKRTISAEGEALELPDLLWLTRVFKVPHRLAWVMTQVAGSLALMLVGAQFSSARWSGLRNTSMSRRCSSPSSSPPSAQNCRRNSTRSSGCGERRMRWRLGT